MLWICIQFYMFPLNFMSTIYFIFGVIQASTGFATYIFFKQETFAQMEKEHLQGQNTDVVEQGCTDTKLLRTGFRQDKKCGVICVRQGKEVRRYEL